MGGFKGICKISLEEEVTVFLGERNRKRRAEIDSPGGLPQWVWEGTEVGPQLWDGGACEAAGARGGGAL